MPLPLPSLWQPETRPHLRGGGGLGKVLLVSQDDDRDARHLVGIEDPVQLPVGLLEAALVGRDDKDEALAAGEVVSPEWVDLVLPAHIPYGEADVLNWLHRLHVEADGGDGVHRLVQLELV